MATQPIHGNYQGYYHKRPSICDLRLALLPSTFFSGKVILDVGCNEGWVSCEIAQQWGAKRVVGVDIDEELIRNAWKRRITLWSLQKPNEGTLSEVPTNGAPRESFQTLAQKIDRGRRFEDAHHFPASFAHTFGPIPFTPSTKLTLAGFPHNVSFRTADWVEGGALEDGEGYDVILAFSVSKWIHLNAGDDGIRRFFQRVYDSLRSGGMFLIEPQSWDGYAKAKRMDGRLKENYQVLELRPEMFGSILESLGFSPGERLGTPGEGGFRRPIDMYTKK